MTSTRRSLISITIVAVVPTHEEAEREVERLNMVNAGKPCRYFWLGANYFPHGRGISMPTAPAEPDQQ
jgi:hypothetical protein